MNPAFSSENASSSGARIVNPPAFAVMSCELMLLMISVVFNNRTKTEKGETGERREGEREQESMAKILVLVPNYFNKLTI